MKSPFSLRPPLRDLGLPKATRPVRAPAPAVARFSAAIVAGLARQTRFVDPDLIVHWGEIAGPEISQLCRPGRITGSPRERTLELIVPHGAAAASVQFAAETLKRRLAAWFGPNFVNRIAVVHGPAPRNRGPSGPPATTPGGGLSRFRQG